MYTEKLFNDISRIIHYTNTKNGVHFKYMQFIVSQLHIHNPILKSNIQNFSFYNHSAMVYELHFLFFFPTFLKLFVATIPVMVHKEDIGGLLTMFPSSRGIMLATWFWLWWEYLHHRNWQALQTRD